MMLHESCRICMKNIALVTKDEKKITYEQLRSYGIQAVNSLIPRKLAFIMVDNNLESIVFFIGCLSKRIVPLLLHNNLPLQQFTNLISTYLPSYLIIPSDFNYKKTNYKNLDLFGNYQVLYRKDIENMYAIDDDLALLLSTSGSTGSPKCVRLSYENLKSNTESICEALQINSNDIAITTLPMDYTYGLSIINTHLYRKASIILNTDSIIHKGFWEKLVKYKCTNFGGVPYTYEVIDKLNLINGIKGLRYLTQAGGKLNHLLVEKYINYCKNNNMKFIVMYGQTEATARISYLPWDKIDKHYGSVGIAIPHGELSIVDTNNKKVCTPYIEGELIYKGRNVSLGYALNYKDLCNGDERKGVLQTGDIAYFDSEGLCYITGRKKRIIKVYGNRINLDEIEQYLIIKGYPSLCVGKDDKILVVYIGDNEGKDISNSIKKELSLKGIIRCAVTVKYMIEKPLNDSDKVDYKKIENMFL